jgi:hypothetical protein
MEAHLDRRTSRPSADASLEVEIGPTGGTAIVRGTGAPRIHRLLECEAKALSAAFRLKGKRAVEIVEQGCWEHHVGAMLDLANPQFVRQGVPAVAAFVDEVVRMRARRRPRRPLGTRHLFAKVLLLATNHAPLRWELTPATVSAAQRRAALLRVAAAHAEAALPRRRPGRPRLLAQATAAIQRTRPFAPPIDLRPADAAAAPHSDDPRAVQQFEAIKRALRRPQSLPPGDPMEPMAHRVVLRRSGCPEEWTAEDHGVAGRIACDLATAIAPRPSHARRADLILQLARLARRHAGTPLDPWCRLIVAAAFCEDPPSGESHAAQRRARRQLTAYTRQRARLEQQPRRTRITRG